MASHCLLPFGLRSANIESQESVENVKKKDLASRPSKEPAWKAGREYSRIRVPCYLNVVTPRPASVLMTLPVMAFD